MQETYKKFQCQKCDFALWKILAGRQFETAEMEQLITRREVGPLQGFRSKMGRLFDANVKLTDEFEMKFDFGEDTEEDAEELDFTGQEPLGKCPRCGGRVFDHGMSYACEKALGSARTCNFKTGKIILTRPIEREQVVKLLHSGKTDLLSKFISKKGRPFSAYLVMARTEKWGSSLSREIQSKKPQHTTMERKNRKTENPKPLIERFSCRVKMRVGTWVGRILCPIIVHICFQFSHLSERPPCVHA